MNVRELMITQFHVLFPLQMKYIFMTLNYSNNNVLLFRGDPNQLLADYKSHNNTPSVVLLIVSDS